MHKQLSLDLGLSESQPIPDSLLLLLQNPKTVLAISVSSGKDSQAMIAYLTHLAKQHQWQCNIFVLHADLGRIEWPPTPQFVCELADRYDLPLVVVRREKGDLIDRWSERREQLQAEGDLKPFWSSPKYRYCTSEMKTQPTDKYLRQFDLIINSMGFRAQESHSRVKRRSLSVRETISGQVFKKMSPDEAIFSKLNTAKGRLALDWLPIHHFDIDTVWQWCGTTTEEWIRRRRLTDDTIATYGWPCHPAYVLGRGNERLSCAFCIMGSENDLKNAIKYNRETYDLLVQMEKESRWSFGHERSLSSLC